MNITYFPLHWIGLIGLPRRVYELQYFADAATFTWVTQLSMVGSMIMGFGMLFFFYNMLKGYRHGEQAPENPWE